MMTSRDRYFNTILFGNPDRIPLAPGGPRESTLKSWRQQGLPENANFMDVICEEFGIMKESRIKMHSAGIKFKMIPEFESEILEHKNGHYVVRDWMGAITEISDKFDPTYLMSAKDFVTRKWHKFPVETREDWEEMKKRYDPYTPERIAKGTTGRVQEAKVNDFVIIIVFNGIFWQLREWCGFENLCMKFVEDPKFVYEMAKFWEDFVSCVLDRFLRHASIDRVLIQEDMAYKAHSMISPEMTREFMQPAYRKWVTQLQRHGCQVIELDSDGYIEELIPIWIESGMNTCSPVEVAAHNDIRRFRDLFGRSMAYSGGIDKRRIAQGGEEMRNHVLSIVPYLFKDGGYLPGCDHGVPPDITWDNFKEYVKLLAKLSGWL